MRNVKSTKVCAGWSSWLKNAGRVEFRATRDDIAALGGHDVRCIEACLHIVQIWGHGDYAIRAASARALAELVETLKPNAQVLVFKLIPMTLDWGHAEQIWAAAGLTLPHGWRGTLTVAPGHVS